MNCFNGEKYLIETIESVINQTYQNWEIIFWDNRSNDSSAKIFNSFSDCRLHYFLAFSHTNLGMARNFAIQKAHGEWIAFLDCDDLWYKDKLENQVEIIQKALLEKINIGLVYGGTECIDAFGKIISSNWQSSQSFPLMEGNLFKELLKRGNFIPLVSALFYKPAISNVSCHLQNFHHAEDYFIVCATAKIFEVRALQKYCCKYRLHGQNASLTTESFIKLDEELRCIEFWTKNSILSKAAFLKKKQRMLISKISLLEILKGEYFSGISLFKKKGYIFELLRSIKDHLLLSIRTKNNSKKINF
ncbi:MAG: glycosyltransferase [Candidatus Riflebacteria bacterium]|nr:glycosyltransferase [Candidatus Riflebacteria bacterium]